MQQAMHGVRFCITLTRQEIKKGWLLVTPTFQFMVKQGLPVEDFQFEDANGRNIPVKPVSVELKTNTVFGVQEPELTAFDLGGWYKKRNMRRGDSVLITILDWENGRFRLKPEPARARQRHRAEIQQQN